MKRLVKPKQVALLSRPLVALYLTMMRATAFAMTVMEFVPMHGPMAGAIRSRVATNLIVRNGCRFACPSPGLHAPRLGRGSTAGDVASRSLARSRISAGSRDLDK